MGERLTPERLAEIRRLADKATPGPWRKDERYVVAGAGRRGFRPSGEVIIAASPTVTRLTAYPYNERIANAAFIAAADPATVLAIVEELGRLRQIEEAATALDAVMSDEAAPDYYARRNAARKALRAALSGPEGEQ